MFDYGVAPLPDEVEITVFGPGYGEAISVHVGDGCWLLADSCVLPSTKKAASLDYLERIGIPFSDVKVIIATHWHDDHVKGLATMVEACTNSTLYISDVFNDREALVFMNAYGGKIASKQTGGTKELFKATRAPNKRAFAHQQSIIWEGNIQGRKMRAVAFSPTHAAKAQSIAHLAKYIPADRDPINHAPELKPNLEAVVINIDLGEDGILLGSDLEDQGDLGWSTIVGDEWCLSNQRASAYKIAHHGSSNGDHPEIWSKLLTVNPIAVLTPYINGSNNLPNAADRARITGCSSSAYISSNGSKQPLINVNLEKRMKAICKNIAVVNTGFGAVRFRKKLGAAKWGVELFGQAIKL